MDELLEMMTAFADAMRPVTNAMTQVLSPALQGLTASITPATAALGLMGSAAGIAATSGFSLLPPILRQVQREFTALMDGLTRLTAVAGDQAVSAFSGLAGAVGAAFGPIGAVIGSALSDLPGLAKSLGSALGQLGSSATLIASTLGGLASGAISSIFDSLTSATQMAAGAMGSFATGLSSAIMGPFQSLAGAVAPFVQALNPGIMRLFNQAMRDLMATFGVAFAPIIQNISAIFNELSATLTPAMRALAPIIDKLMSVLEGTFVPVIGIIADAFVALSPAIDAFSSILASVSEAMRVFYTVVRSAFDVLWQVVSQFFGGIDLKGAAQSFQDVIRSITKNLVVFAAYLAQAVGQLEPFLGALKKNLQDLEGQKPGVKAAPENVHISGLEQISKDMAVAAYAAQGAGGARKKSEAEYLQEIVQLVEKLKDEQTLAQLFDQLKNDLINGFWEDMLKIWEKVMNYLKHDIPGVSDINNAVEEAERGRRLQEQADDMRRRGIPVAGDLGGGFWNNLGDVLRGR